MHSVIFYNTTFLSWVILAISLGIESHTVEDDTFEGVDCSFALSLIENELCIVFHCQNKGKHTKIG